ncbi:MAG TPA: hypothetical protein VG694_00770 [Candidatus Paceibacterota bacterium]|nr:hypothetical protein [Candidatus Paceibacterota bacterium]
MAEPRAEEFGVDPFIYKNYRDDLYVFLKYKIELKSELEKNRWFWPSFIGFLVLTAVSIYFLKTYWFFGSLAAFFAIYYLGILQSNKYRKIRSDMNQLEKTLDPYEASIKEKVAPFEKALAGYWQNRLEALFREKVFKKENTDEFQASAMELWQMLYEAESLNKVLITARIHVGHYERYLARRGAPRPEAGETESPLLLKLRAIDEKIAQNKQTTKYPESFNLKK